MNYGNTSSSSNINKNIAEAKFLRLLYNCNLTLLKDNDGDEILVWSVHWPAIRPDNVSYKKELDHVFENIIKYLEFNERVSFVAIGDFNTNKQDNKVVFRGYELKLNNLNKIHKRQVSSMFSGNDGYMSCLTSNFAKPKFTIDKTPNKPQPLSSHDICVIELIKNININKDASEMIGMSPTVFASFNTDTNSYQIPSNNQPTSIPTSIPKQSLKPWNVEKPVLQPQPVQQSKPWLINQNQSNQFNQSNQYNQNQQNQFNQYNQSTSIRQPSSSPKKPLKQWNSNQNQSPSQSINNQSPKKSTKPWTNKNQLNNMNMDISQQNIQIEPIYQNQNQYQYQNQFLPNEEIVNQQFRQFQQNYQQNSQQIKQPTQIQSLNNKKQKQYIQNRQYIQNKQNQKQYVNNNAPNNQNQYDSNTFIGGALQLYINNKLDYIKLCELC